MQPRQSSGHLTARYIHRCQCERWGGRSIATPWTRPPDIFIEGLLRGFPVGSHDLGELFPSHAVPGSRVRGGLPVDRAPADLHGAPFLAVRADADRDVLILDRLSRDFEFDVMLRHGWTVDRKGERRRFVLVNN